MRGWLAIAAALVVLAGCGTAAAESGGGSAAGGPGGAAGAGGSGGDRGKALAVARRLVDGLHLPAGSVPEPLTKPPAPLAVPGQPQPGWVRATRIFSVRATPRAVWTALLTHAPFSEAPPASVLPVSASITNLAPVPGVGATVLAVSVRSVSRTETAIDAYADAAWRPARTSAEHLDPSRFRAVTVSVTSVFRGGSSGPTRSTTSPIIIARLAGYLNSLPPIPAVVMSCPPPLHTFTVRFTPKRASDPAVLVTASNCPQSYVISVNGEAQPLLRSTGLLENMARDLMGLPWPA